MYDLEDNPAPDAPKLTGVVHVAPDADRLYDDLAFALGSIAHSAVQDRGVFHLALSGGSTPEPFYERLVLDPRFRLFPWQVTHVWIVDERRVPIDHEKSNYRMISHTLLEHVPVKQRHLHPMPAMEDDPVALYENALRRAFDVESGDEPPAIDFVLLGMGDDAHTASLFPGSPAIDESKRWIAVNAGPRVTPPDRVTMTFPLFNAARHVGVLVTGAKKTATLRRIEAALADGSANQTTLPITGVRPAPRDGDEVLTWYMDAAAAGGSE